MIVSVVRLLLAILLLAAAQAFAQGAQTVFLDELTWTELRDEIGAGRRTVLVPIGGTEQSGPYVVLGKHNVRAKALSEKIASALGNALVAPLVAYVPEGSISPPTAHMRFPGTISIPDAVFEKVLEYTARSLQAHGFHDIVFLGDNGGYQKDEQRVAALLNREWASTPVRVHALPEYYRAATVTFAETLRERGFGNDEIGTHAGLADVSLSLAIDPKLVRRDFSQSMTDPNPAHERDGVLGDPRRATAELGQAGVDAIVAQTVEAIKRATARP